MSDRMDRILDDCLTALTAGGASVDDCLAQNPEYADLLRPLLETALKIDGLERPQARRAAFEAGKQLMLGVLARKEEKRSLSRGPKWDFSRRWLSLARSGSRGGAALSQLATVSLLGAATLLVWVAAVGLLLRLWNNTLLPQTCVVADASGVALVQTHPDVAWQPLVTGSVLEPGHRIRTGDPASVTVRFFDGGSTSLGPNTELEIAQLGVRRDGSGQVVVLQQAAGSTHNRVDKQVDSVALFEIETTSASVTAHGTEFKVHVGPDSSTSVVVLEGAVSVTGRETTVTVMTGQAVVVEFDQAPGPVVSAPPEELVESPWAPTPTRTTDGTGTVPTQRRSDATATAPSPESSPEGTHVPPATPEPPTGTATLGPASPTPKPQPPTPTTTPRPPSPTATPERPTPTATPRPPSPTATPQPPSPTPTTVPTSTPEPTEIVEVFYAVYREEQEDLRVKARTNIVGCTLTLEGFGVMEAEGDHWVYVEESLDEDDVPSTVTVRSSCGGSGSSAVSWS